MIRTLVLCTTVAFLFGCGSDIPQTEAIHETAAEAIPTNQDLSRIVTLGGPVTEIVYALGLGEHVVGTDLSSLYPPDILTKPRLSYFRQSSTEGILSLNPTFIIALDGLGPPTVLGQLRTAGVPVLMVPEAETLEAAEVRVDTIGAVLGRPEEAQAILNRMHAQLAGADSLRLLRAPRALFVYARGAGLINVSGTGTAAELVMELAGAQNAVTEFKGFKPLTAEAVVTSAPEVVIIPERGLRSLGGKDELFNQPGLAQTPAGRARLVIAVDDALLLGLGPRIGEGVKTLARELHAAFDLQEQP